MLKPRKKITRAELKRDPLMETVYNIRHFWSAHQRRLNRYTVGLLIMIVLILVFGRWRSAKNDQAATVAGIATMDFGQGRYGEVINQVTQNLEEFGGLPAFGDAVFILARAELLSGDSLLARQHFQLFLDDYGANAVLTSGAWTGLAVIAEGRGQFAEAGKQYHKAYRKAPTRSLRRSNAIFAGRCFILAGRPAEALKLLRPLLEEDDLDLQTSNRAHALASRAEAELRQSDGA